MNYATLAPPITKENAAEYARRATVARERNRARRKQEFLASPDSYARKEVEHEINRILGWMRKAKSRKEHAALARTLDSLWSKAFPEVKAAKPSIRRPPLPVAQHDWEPVASNRPTDESTTPDLRPAPEAEPPAMLPPLATDKWEPAGKPPAPPAVRPTENDLPPPVPVESVPAQIAFAPPKPALASEPVEPNPQQSGPKIYQPHELGAMVCGIGGSRKS